METLLPLLGILFINTVYLLAKLIASIWTGVHEEQIFIGFGRFEALKFKIKNLTIYLGLFIPLPWLARFYSYQNGHKDRIRFEWEYFEIPWPKRLLVTFAGTLGALLVSVVIFTVVTYQDVETYISRQTLNQYGIYPSELAKDYGFEKGDKIIWLNGEDYQKYEDLVSPKTLLYPTTYTILRQKDTVLLTANLNSFDGQNRFMLYPNAPCRMERVVSGTAAERSGFKKGDVITQIDGKDVGCLEEIKQKLSLYRSKSVNVTFRRHGIIDSTSVLVSSEGAIGFVPSSLLEHSVSRKGLLEAVLIGLKAPVDLVMTNIKALNNLLNGTVEGNKKIKGPVGVANLYSNSTIRFFRISAVLMVLMAFWDLFPLPKSAFLRSAPVFYEMMSGKTFSFARFRRFQKLGWVVIVVLTIVMILKDVQRLI